VTGADALIEEPSVCVPGGLSANRKQSQRWRLVTSECMENGDLTKFNPSDPVARQTWSKGDFAGQSAETPTSVFGTCSIEDFFLP
jgi:hypothetical protein